MFVCTALHLELQLQSWKWLSVLRKNHTPLLESLITLIELLTLVITMAIIIPIIIAGVMISIVSVIIELIAYFDFYSFLMKCQAQDLLLYCDLWHYSKKEKKRRIQCTHNVFGAHIDCIGTNNAEWWWRWLLVTICWFPPVFCFDTKTPAPEGTQTLKREEQCTLENAG